MCTLPRRGLQPNTPNTYLIIIERYELLQLVFAPGVQSHRDGESALYISCQAGLKGPVGEP